MKKYLLTSAGIKNASIHAALVELLGKPIADANALCIPTAAMETLMAVLLGHGASSAGSPPNPCASWGGSP